MATTRACRQQPAEGKSGRMLSEVSPCAKAVAGTHRNAHAAGLRDAAAMSIMAAEETVRIASKPVEEIRWRRLQTLMAAHCPPARPQWAHSAPVCAWGTRLQAF